MRSWGVDLGCISTRGSVDAPGQTVSHYYTFRDPETRALWEITEPTPTIRFYSVGYTHLIRFPAGNWIGRRQHSGMTVTGRVGHGEEQQRFWGKSGMCLIISTSNYFHRHPHQGLGRFYKLFIPGRLPQLSSSPAHCGPAITASGGPRQEDRCCRVSDCLEDTPEQSQSARMHNKMPGFNRAWTKRSRVWSLAGKDRLLITWLFCFLFHIEIGKVIIPCFTAVVMIKWRKACYNW